MKRQGNSSRTRRKPITVNFGPMSNGSWRTPPDRRYGGCGVLSKPTPWTGPKTWKIGDRFVVTRLERSPTGSGHGSFQIEERIKARLGWSLIVRGYSCSVPDEAMCKRVVRDSIHS